MRKSDWEVLIAVISFLSDINLIDDDAIWNENSALIAEKNSLIAIEIAKREELIVDLGVKGDE